MARQLTAETLYEALPQFVFQSDRRQVEFAVKHAVNERANNRRTGQCGAGLFPHDTEHGDKG